VALRLLRNWNELVAQVSSHDKRVIVQHDGEPFAAMISAADLEQLERYEEPGNPTSATFHKTGALFSSDELKRELDAAIAEVLAESSRQLTAT
jgi:hypothetical protein